MPQRVDKARQIERALGNVYSQLLTAIRKDPSYPAEFSLIKAKHQFKAYSATRKAVETVYTAGTEYVGKKLNVDIYQTDQDNSIIKQETDKAITAFWNRIYDDMLRQRQIDKAKQATDREIPDKLNTNYFLTAIAGVAAFGALGQGTKTKAKQVIPQIAAPIPTQPPDRVPPNKPGPGSGGREIPPGAFRIKWIAQQDEKTCRQLPNGESGCYYLDGMEWDYGDPEVKDPAGIGESGTHPNCRCYLEISTNVGYNIQEV